MDGWMDGWINGSQNVSFNYLYTLCVYSLCRYVPVVVVCRWVDLQHMMDRFDSGEKRVTVTSHSFSKNLWCHELNKKQDISFEYMTSF